MLPLLRFSNSTQQGDEEETSLADYVGQALAHDVVDLVLTGLHAADVDDAGAKQLLRDRDLRQHAAAAIQAASNGIQMLAAGFTIVRDMGNNGLYADTALRQAIEEGWIPGPQIINAGIIIGGGGQFWPTPEMGIEKKVTYPEYLEADTPDELVKAVRQNMLYGAKVIKICADCKPGATRWTTSSWWSPRPRRLV